MESQWCKTAEGSMNEISNILIRLRELGVQGASDTIGDAERGFINLEVEQLTSEVERIAQSTIFNGRALINGEGESELHFQVGPNGGEENVIMFAADATNATVSESGIDGLDMSDRDGASDALETVDNAIQQLNGNRASLGAMQSRLYSASKNLGSMIQNTESAKSRVLDADFAKETSELVQNSILQSANIAVLAQANQTSSAALRLL